SYALYLAYEYDLHSYDSMIFNMVSERYPRDEDDDSAANFDSAIEEDEDLSHDVAMEVSASEAQSSSICNHICFGNFGNSDLSAVQFASITPIKPTIDGFTIKIGEIACLLVTSSYNSESVFAALEDDEKSKNLDSEVVVSEAIKG
ncbi:pentatricopeptide repeat-containing protein, partial [Trifolium medium]|nr:pentatricopeptide repeat-containing protein [Trifolium medium]